jgi:hypothetical protein
MVLGQSCLAAVKRPASEGKACVVLSDRQTAGVYQVLLFMEGAAFATGRSAFLSVCDQSAVLLCL